ncbi:MAG: phosphoribosylformylglycinamidine synthase subunit PurS [Candidatus Thermoplasmatota archaeon]
MIKVRVEIKLKKGIVDPEGKNILKALNLLGFKNIKNVKTSKIVEMLIDEKDENNVAKEVEEMCKKLLVNPVVNDYSVEIENVQE